MDINNLNATSSLLEFSESFYRLCLVDLQWNATTNRIQMPVGAPLLISRKHIVLMSTGKENSFETFFGNYQKQFQGQR